MLFSCKQSHKRFLGLISFTLVFAIPGPPLYGSQLAQSQPVDPKLPERFVQTVYNSCYNGDSKLVGPSRHKFCKCYADVFNKYSAEELAMISQLASASSEARQSLLVALNPDRKACMQLAK